MNPIAIAFFVPTIILTLLITYYASRKNRATLSHYVADRQIRGWQNGMAIAGDFISGASFLGIAGAFALSGYNAVYLAIGVPVAYVLVLLILAEPMRGLGRYTVADVMASRFDSRKLRLVAAVNAIVISVVYMVVQFIGAGLLVGVLFGVDYALAVVGAGVLVTIYVAVGGMRATTWVQIFQTTLLGIGFVALVLLTLEQFDFNPLALFGDAIDMYGRESMTPPPLGLVDGLDVISVSLALALGCLGLPHIIIRFLTVPDARAARSSALTASWIFSIFYILLPIVGYGAAVLVGRQAIADTHPRGNLAAIQLTGLLGGDVFLGFMVAVVFVVLIATLAGLNIAASGAVAHDIYTNLLRRGNASDREQHRAARVAGIGISIFAVLLALGARDFNLAYLALLAFAIAASTNLPMLILTISWRRFNLAGALTGMTTGLVVSVGLVVVSPNVMGDGAIFPLTNPAIVSIPVGFMACYLGTVRSRRHAEREVDDLRFAEVQVRAHAGASVVGRKDQS